MAAFFYSCLPTMRFPLTLFQFLSILSLFCSNAASAQCLDNQKSSLLTLFGSSPISSWTPNTDCCVWKGVTCDGSGHVTGLDFTNHGIRAPINSTSLTTLSSLRNLNLSSNLFNSSIPVSISDLSKLTHLNLSNSGFKGYVPVEISRIKSLESLDLSSNSLSYLRFKSHDFGHVIGNLSGLRELFLDRVDISSPAPESLGILSNLTSLHLQACKLTGQFPRKIFQLQNLESIDLSGNYLLSGTLPEFPSDSKLQILSLSSTSFIGELPNSFGNLRYLRRLEVNACNFSGRIPSSLGRISQLSHFDISQNNFSGQVPSLENLTQLAYLDLHSNKLQGSIPIPPHSVSILDYSHNNFTSVIPENISLYFSDTLFLFSLSDNNIGGKIPSSLCNAIKLTALDLSMNNLSGSIPHCLVEMDNLRVLNLEKNNFSGIIPRRFGHGCSLQTLNLNQNRLEGSLPRSLTYCKQLQVLNIGYNGINDFFPSWLGSLKQLQVLILQSNKFHGPIHEPEDRDAFSKLHIIDLSSNGFTSNLSFKWFTNLKGMMDDDKPEILEFLFPDLYQYYTERVTITLKGLEMEFSKVLTIFSSIDFSNNKFHGRIPEEIGNLKSLVVLNMSHNEFSGPIPLSFGNLQQLGALDLSMNRLSGEIPIELTAPSFLSVLNLSQNRLVGRIPLERQFSIFGEHSYEGNPGLCGPPLSMQCEAPQEPEAPGEPGSENLPSRKYFDWRYMCMGLGFGFGNWMVMGPVIFWRRGRLWYYKHVDNIFSVLLLWWDTYVMAIIKPKQGTSGRVHGSASDPTEVMDDDFTIWTWMEEKSSE